MKLNQNKSSKEIKRLYEDDYFVVFDKPSGLLVIPSPKKEAHTLSSIVNQNRDQQEAKLYPCHRLDRDTSGAIIYAYGKKNQQVMMELFKKRLIKKKYTAFVHGQIKRTQGTIAKPIKHLERNVYRKKAEPIKAITKYKVLKHKKKYTVVEAIPVTGRTNQIRIHFSQIAHPLVGERKYAFAKDFLLKFKRTALHAASLEWKHPYLNKTIKVQSELPKDMEVFIARNRN